MRTGDGGSRRRLSPLLPLLNDSVEKCGPELPSFEECDGHGSDLSRREQQLIELVCWGLTNKEIASRLNLSEHTVKNHPPLQVLLDSPLLGSTTK